MIYDFLFREEYTLIAIDIIEGIDDNFYIVDVNGYVSLNPILQYTEDFVSNAKKYIGDFYFDCHEDLIDFDKLNIGTNNPETKTWIINRGFSYENKLNWREKFNFKSPNINSDITFHDNPNYPKYLIKPSNGFRAKGIKIFNDENPVLEEEQKQPQSDIEKQMNDFFEIFSKSKQKEFIEEFIPSKLIDDYCYAIRVLMLINHDNVFPVLKLHRRCANPVIKNLKKGRLSFEESLSYLTNVTDINKKFYKHECERLDKFVDQLKVHN